MADLEQPGPLENRKIPACSRALRAGQQQQRGQYQKGYEGTSESDEWDEGGPDEK